MSKLIEIRHFTYKPTAVVLDCSMDYAFWFMMMVVACIVYSVLQYTLKAAVRRFTRRGIVENEDHSYIIEGILVKTIFQFLACEVESLNVS